MQQVDARLRAVLLGVGSRLLTGCGRDVARRTRSSREALARLRPYALSRSATTKMVAIAAGPSSLSSSAGVTTVVH